MNEAQALTLEAGKTRHTPLPWAAVSNGVYWTIQGDYEFGQIGDTCSSSASAPEYGRSMDLGQANAEFIARACNAHEDLLSACLGVKAMLEGMGQPIPAMLANAITIGKGGTISLAADNAGLNGEAA